MPKKSNPSRSSLERADILAAFVLAVSVGDFTAALRDLPFGFYCGREKDGSAVVFLSVNPGAPIEGRGATPIAALRDAVRQDPELRALLAQYDTAEAAQ